MAGPLEPRVELRSKWGRFKSSKKALNAPLVFCCGGIPVGADFACSSAELDCVTLPGEYMWPENPDGSVGSPSKSVTYDNKNGYSSLTDFHVYTPMYTSGPSRKSGKHWKNYDAKTFATESWNELQTILTRYKIQPSAKIILGFSGGVAFVTGNIATFGGKWTYWDTVLLAGAWAPKGKNDAGVKQIQQAKKQNPNTYYFSGGTAAGADDFDNPGFDETAKLYGKDFIKTSKGHMPLVPYTAKWIKDNVKVSSTGEAATPSGAATSTGTGGTPNPTPTGTSTPTGTGGVETPTKKTVTTTTMNTTGPGWLKPGNITVDERGLEFLKRYEGTRFQVYDDANSKTISTYEEAKGYPTIGIGHLIGGGEKPFYSTYLGGREKMTLDQVHKLKQKDMLRFTNPLNQRLQQPVTQNMFNGMIALGFNTGMNGPTIKKAIALVNTKDYEGAAKAIENGTNTSKGKVLDGLTKRRKAEADLFREGMPSSQPTAENTTGPSETVTSEVVEENGTNAQVATASNDCNDLQKEDAKLKSNESPEGAKEEEVAKDPLPPPKDETPVSLDGKYNHRFYILPTKEAKPLTLAEMVDKKQKYYKRYWAWRTDENPGYGVAANELKLVSDDGKNLITGLVPYWPPHSGSFDDIKEPTVQGKWLNLIKGQKDIQSFLDIPILLNAYDVGVYNDNIGYVFEAGNELHMTLLEKVFLTNKGSQIGIGNAVNTTITDKKNQDSSWREWPKWSGIWVDHCLKKSGYSLHGDINVNINTYHEKVLSGGKLINYPGNKEWKWKDLKAAGMQDLVFKPSKIWYDTANLNSDELLKDSGDIAIFIVDYHIKKDGTLTERGQKLLDKIISLNWKLGVVSAVKSHTAQSNQLYAEVLVYLDKTGKMVTFGGNTTPRGADSIPGGGPYHIAIKETNFKDFAILAGDNWINGAVFISNVKSAPEGHRVGGLDSKIYTTDIFKDYYKRVDNEKGKLTGRMYNFLLPYIDQKPAAPAPAKIEPQDSNEVKHTSLPVSIDNNGEKTTIEAILDDTPIAVQKGIISPIPGMPGKHLRSNAIADFVAMVAAAKAAGFDIPGSIGGDPTRTVGKQISLWKNQNPPLGNTHRFMDKNNPNDAKLIKIPGSDSYTTGGNPNDVAPPLGYHGSNPKKYRGGSYHQRGRAIDVGSAKGSIGDRGLGQNYKKYQQVWQKPVQKWIRENGEKYAWYSYWQEVWHFNYKFSGNVTP